MSVWGSAAGLLVSWEPFDFGLRKANVLAAAGAAGADADLQRPLRGGYGCRRQIFDPAGRPADQGSRHSRGGTGPDIAK